MRTKVRVPVWRGASSIWRRQPRDSPWEACSPSINGYQGSKGYMPPKGGRADLSDEEIIAAIDYMVEQVQ